MIILIITMQKLPAFSAARENHLRVFETGSQFRDIFFPKIELFHLYLHHGQRI